ncbi:unnamed protein product [Sphagnum balticum]
MKGVGVAVTTIPIMKAKVVAAIVLAVKVEVASPVMKAKEVDLYNQEPSAMELKKAYDIGTRAFFATFDGPTSSACVEDNNATELATKSDI